jgi:uncharacterized protein with PQ loop repeat
MVESVKSKPAKSVFEKFMLVFATVEPLATIPQIYSIWTSSSAPGVSLTTWVFYTITSFIWLAYGIRGKDTPIIISGLLWSSTQALVVIGLLTR